MQTPITKERALQAFGGSQAELARALKIKPQAVQQWPDGEPIPELRQWQLCALRPDIFGKAPTTSAKKRRKVA